MILPDSCHDVPKLRGSYSVENGELIVRQGGQSFVVSSPPEYQTQIAAWLARTTDGQAAVPDVKDPLSLELVSALEEQGLLEQVPRSEGLSGSGALLILEDYANELLYKTLYKNIFWQHIQTATQREIPNSVIYGFVIENYHFLYRESWFDSPA